MSTSSSSRNPMALLVRTANPLDDARRILERPGDVSIAVAFVTSSGVDEIRPQLVAKLDSGSLVRVLMDLRDAATDPSAIWDLLALSTDYGNLLQLRAFVADTGILHTKLYIAREEPGLEIMTGSANLSFSAFHHNEEHGIYLTGNLEDDVLREAATRFDDLWSATSAYDIDEEAARLYEAYCGRRRAVAERARRRSSSAWNKLAQHFAEGLPNRFEWPSTSAAFIVGAIAARGYLDPSKRKISIRLKFNPRVYTGGRVTVQGVSYDAATVLPDIPQFIASAASSGLPGTAVTIEGRNVIIDCTKAPEIMDALEEVFAPALTCSNFGLPHGLVTASDGLVTEFLSGFAVASALVTENTSLPKNPRTGLPGIMTVWIRPKQGNRILFDGLYELISRRLGFTVYRHWREDREPHLKIRCDDFAEIGFGIEWWDQLVRAGSEYNQSHFAQPLPMPLEM